MFSKAYEFFQSYQPISWTGIPRHMLLWMTSGFSDVVYQNPKYKVPDDDIVENEIAIYCVHGTVDRSAAFSLIAERLLPELPESVASIHLVTFTIFFESKNIESFAEELLKKIKLNKHKNVILIGHSRGGLIVSYLDAYLAKKAGVNVYAVINVCSPFAGSKYAMAPISSIMESVKEMEIGSDFLKNLSEKIIQSDSRYYYFAAADDSVVTPDACCIKEHKDAMITLDRHGHLSILSSHRLVNYLKIYVSDAVSASLSTPAFKLFGLNRL